MAIKPYYIKNISKEIMRLCPHLITTNFEKNKEFLNKYVGAGSNKMRNILAGRLVVDKKNEGRIIIPPYKGKPKKRKGWKKKEKRNRR